MTGSEITKVIRRDVERVQLTVSFPNYAMKYDSGFFKFENSIVTEELPAHKPSRRNSGTECPRMPTKTARSSASSAARRNSKRGK